MCVGVCVCGGGTVVGGSSFLKPWNCPMANQFHHTRSGLEYWFVKEVCVGGGGV